ncbi:MAG: hypothetical protein SVV67_08145 [Bacillota bacterium]|nr:hypothetical protein [Bacillota bacterium]
MKIKWDLEHVYFYLVSFVALILIIVGAVTITQTVIAYFTPVYDYYGPFAPERPSAELSKWEEKFGSDFIEQERIRYEEINRRNYNRQLSRDLVRGLAFIIVALPVYLYHWRRIPRLELAEQKSDPDS